MNKYILPNGRKIFIFGGLSVYILFSVLISLSQNVEQMWVFRFFQAVGGGFAVVNTSAIVRDVYHGKEGAKIFSIISMIIMIAPMLAPVVGFMIAALVGFTASYFHDGTLQPIFLLMMCTSFLSLSLLMLLLKRRS